MCLMGAGGFDDIIIKKDNCNCKGGCGENCNCTCKIVNNTDNNNNREEKKLLE